MSIVETMGDAIAASVGERVIGRRLPAMVPEVMARAALRAIKPEDVSEKMRDAFGSEWIKPITDSDESRADRLRRALAAAIAAGAEQ